MNEDQALDLLELLAASNVINRLDPRAPEVWAAALSDLEYRDCMQAAAHLIRTERWVKIADVRDAVHTIRTKRIDAANVIYDGNPIESGEQSAHSLRALLRAAGDGQVGQRATRQAIPDRRPLELEAGPSSRLRAAIGAIGATPPRQVPGVTNPLSVGCPKCAAKPGKSCASGLRKRRVHADPHPSRVEFAKRLAAGLTEDGAA